MDFDYKKYSLENLEKWLHDALSAGEASPQEIYDTIKNVVQEEYYYYKNGVSKNYELLCLLNGNGYTNLTDEGVIAPNVNQVPVDTILNCDKDDPSPECKGAWNDFWESNSNVEYELREAEFYNKKDKVVKWQLPIEVDGLTGDCYVNFPDDLLEAANLKEGDTVEWVDNGNGTFILRKVNK